MLISSVNDIDTTTPFTVPHGLFCYPTDSKRLLIGGSLTDGGSVIKWMKDILSFTYTDDDADNNFAICMDQVQRSIFYHNRPTTGQNNNKVVVVPFLSG